MDESRINWVTPGGMYIPEQSTPIVGVPCLLVLKGGRSQLGQLLRFDPRQTHFLFSSNHHPDPIEISIAYVMWMRLLTPAHLFKAGSLQPYQDEEWERLLKTVDIHFKAGEALSGQAPALMQTENGWFFFLVKDTAEVYRYFIPHHSVERVVLNGAVQQRLDSSAPIPREMKNERLAELLGDRPEKYPYALEARFERVLGRIMNLWDEPEALQAYFEELMVDKRGGRQGFPEDVAHDIFVLSGIYDDFLRRPEPEADPWAADQARRELEYQGHSYTPQRFHHVVERNNYEATLLYLDAGMAVDAPGEAGWTPLMVASFNGNEAIAELLLQRGANAFAIDGAGYTPLHWAAFNGFARVTKILLGKRVDVNASNRYGWTPLLQAAARGHTEIVRLLLSAGAKATVADQEGWTPLHKAVANRYPEIVELLLAQGASPSAPHRSGVTPLQLAEQKGFPEISQRLRLAVQEGLTRLEADGSIRFKPSGSS